MTAVLVDAARNLASALNLTYRASYGDYAKPLDSFKDQGTIVDVVPGEYLETSADSHTSIGYVVSVHIFIRKYIQPQVGLVLEQEEALTPEDEVDQMLALIESLHERCFVLNTVGGCFTHVETRIAVPFDPEKLRTEHLFIARIDVTLETSKKLVHARTHTHP